MPIVIKELFPSDPLSEALEKINFNFDQIVLAGGGPPGPQGPQGVPGIPGPQGERGDHWQVGALAPTIDHGPNFGSLKDFDYWIDAGGTVNYWDSISSTWIPSSTNLKGPQGLPGTPGGSFEMTYHQGSTGNALPPTLGGQNYVPNVTPSTSPSTDSGFIIPREIDLNSLFLADAGWAYNKLNNFNVRDTIPPVVPGTNPSTQRLNPKLMVIQTGIDYTGFGGLTIGAYGATDGTSPIASLLDYVGSTSIDTDAYNFFTAGFAINEPSLGNINHIFKAGTRKIDFELFAGDLLNSSIFPGSAPNLILRTTSNGQVRVMNTGSTNPRAVFDESYTLFRPKTSIGHLVPPIWDSLSTFDNAGSGRNRGELYVGDLSGATAYIGVGKSRTSNGSSIIDLFATNTSTPRLQISALTNGSSQIVHDNGTGTRPLSIVSVSPNAPILFSTSNTERMRIDPAGNVGIGTALPITRLDVNGPIRTSGNSGLPSSVSDSPILAGNFGTPNIGRLYIGNGTGWKFHFSRRDVSIDTDLVTLIDNGSVGIGTTNPQLGLLDVQGKGSLGGANNANTAVFKGSADSAGISIGADWPSIRFNAYWNSGLKSMSSSGWASSITADQGSGGLVFSTSPTVITSIDSVVSTTIAMRIDKDGKVSIGNNITPEQRLHIEDNSQTPVLIRSRNSTTTTLNQILLQRSLGTGVPVNGVDLGNIAFGGWNGTAWTAPGVGGGGAAISAKSSGTWSVSSNPTDLSFTTTGNSEIISRERLRIHKDGKITIGDYTNPLEIPVLPSFNMSIGNTSDYSIGIERVSSSGNPGRNFFIGAGGGNGFNQAGGVLILAGGRSTGSESGEVQIWNSDPTSTFGGDSTYRPYSTIPSLRSRYGSTWINSALSVPDLGSLTVTGEIAIFQSQGTNNQDRDLGLKFHLSTQPDNSRYASIVPYEGNAANNQIGLSFRTANNAVGVTRMRIYPDGGIQMVDDQWRIGLSGFEKIWTLPKTITNNSPSGEVHTILATNYDRIVYVRPEPKYAGQQIAGQQFGYVTLTIFMQGEVIFYNTANRQASGIGVVDRGNSYTAGINYCFILPANQAADMRMDFVNVYSTGAPSDPPLEWKCIWQGIGMR